jgi:hypothetical protein
MLQPLAQRLALHQLRHHIAGAGWQRPNVVERADVRVIQCRDSASLMLESRAELFLCNFDSDRASQARVAGLEDLAYAASPSSASIR